MHPTLKPNIKHPLNIQYCLQRTAETRVKSKTFLYFCIENNSSAPKPQESARQGFCSVKNSVVYRVLLCVYLQIFLLKYVCFFCKIFHAVMIPMLSLP